MIVGLLVVFATIFQKEKVTSEPSKVLDSHKWFMNPQEPGEVMVKDGCFPGSSLVCGKVGILGELCF